MIDKKLLFFIGMLSPLILFGQYPSQKEAFSCHCSMMNSGVKGKFYIAAGYNLDWFTTSDIHFKDNTTANYDFTLYNVKAEDKPGFHDFFHQDITIPQYSYRAGYFFGDRGQWGIEVNYDHVKYVMINDQYVHLTGDINGEQYDKDTLLIEQFVRYEHTNGANYLMFNGIARKDLLHAKNELHWLSVVGKFGGGIVLPRTDSYVMGLHRNDSYHVAGYVFGLDAGLRYDFLKHFFFETSAKGCYANYYNVNLYGQGKASQHWFSFEYVFTIGYQFNAKLF